MVTLNTETSNQENRASITQCYTVVDNRNIKKLCSFMAKYILLSLKRPISDVKLDVTGNSK